MNWFELLQAFEKTAKNESFAQAARELHVNTSAITKRIQQLEFALKTTLFIRTTRKVWLTEEGMLLLSRIKPFLNEWHDIRSQLIDIGAQPQGRITIASPAAINSAPVFVRLFDQFMQKFPKIRLCVNSIAGPISLFNTDTDILLATESYLLEEQDVIGIKLITLYYQCYAAQSYIDKHGMPETIEDLYQHNCLIHANNPWQLNGKDWFFTGNLFGNSGDSLTTACKLGIGIFYAPYFVLKDEIESKTIVPVLLNATGRKVDILLYYKKHQYTPRKIRTFLDFIAIEKDNINL